MARSLSEIYQTILSTLAAQPRDPRRGSKPTTAQELADATKLSPAEINDGVALLVEDGLAGWERHLGTAPFSFARVFITPRGRNEFEQAKQAAGSEIAPILSIARPLTPVGSPFGFRDEDWEISVERRARVDQLFVVLGYQVASDHYATDELRRNIEQAFSDAVSQYNRKPEAVKCSLQFQPLAAGYGEHLFNEIARDVISADIAVFDTSDLNPNVMLEMGVALTWGVRVLPIKAEGCPKPPSDISGQTWADYKESGRIFLDSDHEKKLAQMVQRAARKKP